MILGHDNINSIWDYSDSTENFIRKISLYLKSEQVYSKIKKSDKHSITDVIISCLS